MYTEKDLNELEQFFKSIPDSELPQEIDVVQSQRVIEVRKFIDGHLQALRSNIGNSTFSAFHDRLIALKNHLQK